MWRNIAVMAMALMLAAPAWAQPAASSGDAVPDAMKRMPKAPNVDYAHLRDPFSSALVMSSGLALKERRLHSDHPHEELEDFDLSTLKLVAVYSMGADRVAMIQNAEGKGYIVHRGNYMGKHDGRIVAIGSSGVDAPIPGLVRSNAGRAALAGYLKTLAGEVAADGVTVNMVLPGRIATKRLAELDTARARASGQEVAAIGAVAIGAIPAARYGTPAEFASVAVFLCGEGAAYVTGTRIRVDGGIRMPPK